MYGRAWQRLLAVVLALTVLLGCAPRWEMALSVDGRAVGALSAEGWRTAAELAEPEAEDEALPLDRLLWEAGVPAVEALAVDGTEWAWHEVADTASITADGALYLAGKVYHPQRLEVTSPAEETYIAGTLLDLAPTVAVALGVEPPALAEGQPLETVRADHVLFAFLDGLGYRRYLAWRGQGVTPYLDSLAEPRALRTVYPSVTTVSTAAMLTGAPPSANGVPTSGIRRAEAQTFLQVLEAAGRSAVAVEGDAIPLAMPGAETLLSGDRDGDGSTDDNVRANALDVLAAGAPDFLWVHWHGIDDAGHSYGPDAEETRATAHAVDGYLAEVVEALPSGTLVMIVADHGMHLVSEGERLGNHGTLMPEDMYVPFWAFLR